MQPSPIAETSGPFRPNRTNRISISRIFQARNSEQSVIEFVVRRICRTPCKPRVSRGSFASETRTPPPALNSCGRPRRWCHVPMEHTHRDSFYRFCCAGDNRSRATAETGRKTGRGTGRARGPCRPCSSRGSRASPGACASRRGRSARGAAHRRATRVRAARSPTNAPRRAAAVGSALRRAAGLGHGTTRADAANLCGSDAATAANCRPRRPGWSETSPNRPSLVRATMRRAHPRRRAPRRRWALRRRALRQQRSPLASDAMGPRSKM